MTILPINEGFKTSAHFESLKALFQSFYDEEIVLHRQIDNGYAPAWTEFTEWLEGIAKYGEVFYICAEEAGVVKGVTVFTINADEVGVVMLYVHQDHRQQGLASEMMERLITYTNEYQVPRIELTVVGINLPAIKLYSKFGFFTSLYYMNRKIA